MLPAGKGIYAHIWVGRGVFSHNFHDNIFYWKWLSIWKQFIQKNFLSLTDWKIDLFKALLAFLKLKLKQTKINLSEIPLVDLGVDSFKDKLFSSVIILISLNFNHVIESFLLYRPHHSLIQLALPTLIKLPSSVSERYRKKITQYKNGKIRNKLSSFFCSLICFYPFLLLPPPSLLPLPPPSSLPPFPSLPPSPLLPSPLPLPPSFPPPPSSLGCPWYKCLFVTLVIYWFV